MAKLVSCSQLELNSNSLPQLPIPIKAFCIPNLQIQLPHSTMPPKTIPKLGVRRSERRAAKPTIPCAPVSTRSRKLAEEGGSKKAKNSKAKSAVRERLVKAMAVGGGNFAES
jgi:hypothetical protein